MGTLLSRTAHGGELHLCGLEGSVWQGYMKGSEAKTERKEAAPFPLVAVLALEQVFCMDQVPLGYLLLAGFFLACIWGSLRFSDGSCTSPKSLSIEGWILRGT